jgi:hypothetical protein
VPGHLLFRCYPWLLTPRRMRGDRTGPGYRRGRQGPRCIPEVTRRPARCQNSRRASDPLPSAPCPLVSGDLRACRASGSCTEITRSPATLRAIRYRLSVPSPPSAGSAIVPVDLRLAGRGVDMPGARRRDQLRRTRHDPADRSDQLGDGVPGSRRHRPGPWSPAPARRYRSARTAADTSATRPVMAVIALHPGHDPSARTAAAG